MRTAARTVTMLLLVPLALAAGCRKQATLVNEVVAVPAAAVPVDPGDAAWNAAPEHVAKLILQDLVEPRQMKVTTTEVRVRAITTGSEVAFRLEWDDDTRSDAPGPSSMVDACAVQIPATFEKEPPAPQMGETGRTVDVTFWRADWQATVDGRGDTIRDLYPNASIDHYPFNAQSLEPGSAEQAEMAQRYAPARSLGNTRSGPRKAPVEDLVAQGPGTLSPAPEPRGSDGRGVHGKTGWSVVIKRAWPRDVPAGQRSSIAFAVWQGSLQESGARKMRTGWIPLLARETK